MLVVKNVVDQARSIVREARMIGARNASVLQVVSTWSWASTTVRTSMEWT